jgi:hypothetical protein
VCGQYGRRTDKQRIAERMQAHDNASQIKTGTRMNKRPLPWRRRCNEQTRIVHLAATSFRPRHRRSEGLLTQRVGYSESCEHRLSASAQPLDGWHGMTSAVPLRTGILLSAPQQGRCIQCE